MTLLQWIQDILYATFLLYMEMSPYLILGLAFVGLMNLFINKDLINILNIWAKFLFSPLLKDKVMMMQETNSTAYGAEAASKVHKELKKIGGVKPPREFVFMDRAAIGLGSVFLHLGAELNWYKIFNELISDFDEKIVEKNQKQLVKKTKLGRSF